MPNQGVPVTERQRVAKQCPHHSHEAKGDETHHHGVEGVLGPDEAAVEKRQGRRHQQHEGSRNQHPRGVGLIHRITSETRTSWYATVKSRTTASEAASWAPQRRNLSARMLLQIRARAKRKGPPEGGPFCFGVWRRGGPGSRGPPYYLMPSDSRSCRAAARGCGPCWPHRSRSS